MARKNILDITAQKFAAKKLALRRMILRKLATRRLAARKTAALGMVMLLLGGCHVAQLTTLYTDETSVEENGIRYDAAHRPITGVYQKYADNMQLQEEIHYVDGKISGLKRITKKGSRTAKPWNIILTARKKKSAIIARANPKAEKLPIIRTAISDAKEATSEAKRTVCLKNITKTARSRHP